jgi:nucleoside-diphosphate-sugar epimerase
MIVGSGMMAQAFSAFRGDDEVLVFASGVADSLETRAEAFARERDLLQKTRAAFPEKLLVYFGTCSVEDPDRRESPYTAHKLEMEAILERSGSPWMVLRLPLAIGPGRRGRTLAPFLFDRISRGIRFGVWQHAIRYPIDVEDASRIAAAMILSRAFLNRRINVALRAYPVLAFVEAMENIVGKRAVYEVLPKGTHYAIHHPELDEMAPGLALDLTEQYLDRVLRKYFSTPDIAT